ncbi:MAG TPA: hypothetical protein VES42_01900 [Pilimelia sp.]|nr:hypothetical protein [Pilimelia sp.]
MRTPRAAGKLTRMLTVAVLMAVAGCAGGPSPAAWAASVCQALAPWRLQIGDLTAHTNQQMTAATTPAQAKENLVRLFGGAREASETARRHVERAGVPDVDGGAEVVRRFLASLAAARDAYGRASDAIAALDTGRATSFYDGVEAAVAVLKQDYGRSALDTTNLDSPKLRRAFDEAPECR